MILEIVSPEATLLHTDVDLVSVPGINGEFQMLNNHAPIVSLLVEGSVRFKGATSSAITCDYIAASFTISQEYTSGGGGSTRRRAVYVAKNNPDN